MAGTYGQYTSGGLYESNRRRSRGFYPKRNDNNWITFVYPFELFSNSRVNKKTLPLAKTHNNSQKPKITSMTPQDFIKNYEKALATQDWKNVAPLMAEQASVTFSNGVVHMGKAAVKMAFEKNFALIKNEAYNISNVRWLLLGETTAVYLFEFSWKGIINGKAAGGNGIGTSVLIREQDKWVLLTEHLGK